MTDCCICSACWLIRLVIVVQHGRKYLWSTIDMKRRNLRCSTSDSGKSQPTIKSSMSDLVMALCCICEVAYVVTWFARKKVETDGCETSVLVDAARYDAYLQWPHYRDRNFNRKPSQEKDVGTSLAILVHIIGPTLACTLVLGWLDVGRPSGLRWRNDKLTTLA